MNASNDLSLLNQIHEAPADMQVRLNLTMQPGNVAHQGDLYIIMLATEPDAKKHHSKASGMCKSISKNTPLGEPTNVRQLALGDTIGSKHIAVASGFSPTINPPNAMSTNDPFLALNKAKMGQMIIYARTTTHNPLTGPTIEAHGEWTLTHPEHAHHVFPKGTYIAVYQRDFAAEAMAAVRD